MKISKNLENMTRDELRVVAKQLNIQGRGHMSKEELRAACLKAMTVVVVAPPAPPAPPQDEKVNHFVIILDGSYSMSTLATEALTAVNKNIETIKSEAYRTGMNSTITFLTFGDYVRNIFYKRPAKEVKAIPRSDYLITGCTALFDSVGTTIDRLLKDAKANSDESYVFMIVTDGYENASRGAYRVAETLRQRITDMQLTDRWTFAFMVPGGGAYKHVLMRKLGIPQGNIAEWEIGTVEGMNTVSMNLNTGVQNFYLTRSLGKTSTQTFYTDLSHVTKKQVTNLDDLSPKVQEASVSEDTDVKTFCVGRFGNYVLGGLYYELTKPEKIHSYKKILIMEKNGSRIYGGHQARQLLKLPSQDIRVKPGDHGNYQIFIQSTSVNRKLIKGTKVLYAPTL